MRRLAAPAVLCALVTTSFAPPALSAEPDPAFSNTSPARMAFWTLTPFDMKTGAYDIERVEHINTTPSFDTGNLFIPYDTLRTELAALAAQLDGNAEIDLDEVGELQTSHRLVAYFAYGAHQPELTQVAPHTFRLWWANNLIIKSVTRTRGEGAVGDFVGDALDHDMMFDVRVEIEGRLELWPTIHWVVDHAPRVSRLELVDIELKGLLFSRPRSKAIWETLFTELFNQYQRPKVLAYAQQLAQRLINVQQTAEAIRANIVNRPITVGATTTTLQDLIDDQGASIDVRERLVDNELSLAAFVRMPTRAGNGVMNGTISLPAQACESRGSELGGVMGATNEGISGTRCADLINGDTILVNQWLGANPARFIDEPTAALPEWARAGTIQTTGSFQRRTDAQGRSRYECPFTVTGLPDFAIVEIGARFGGALHAKLDEYTFRQRFTVVGPAMFDGSNRPVPSLDFGGPGPEGAHECTTPPTIILHPDKELTARFGTNLDQCPQCGMISVFNGIRSRVRDALAPVALPANAQRVPVTSISDALKRSGPMLNGRAVSKVLVRTKDAELPVRRHTLKLGRADLEALGADAATLGGDVSARFQKARAEYEASHGMR